MMTAPPAVSIKNLQIALPKGAERAFAVDGVSLDLRPGKIVCVVGESGSGKSMCAHALMGLLPDTVNVTSGEILPNALSPVIVLASLMVATAILLESSLSFLGLGDPNLMSWGYMVGAGRTVIRQAWWITVFPGVAILISVLGLNLIGEGINDALNPRLSREGR